MKSRARLKAIAQSILHADLAPRCPHADLFGGKGRAWLRAQVVPEDERVAIERHLEEYDRQTAAQKAVERDIAGRVMRERLSNAGRQRQEARKWSLRAEFLWTS